MERTGSVIAFLDLFMFHNSPVKPQTVSPLASLYSGTPKCLYLRQRDVAGSVHQLAKAAQVVVQAVSPDNAIMEGSKIEVLDVPDRTSIAHLCGHLGKP